MTVRQNDTIQKTRNKRRSKIEIKHRIARGAVDTPIHVYPISVYIVIVIVIVIVIWWSPFIHSRNLDEVFIYNHVWL